MGEYRQAPGGMNGFYCVLTGYSPFWNIGRLASTDVLFESPLYRPAFSQSHQLAGDMHASDYAPCVGFDLLPVNRNTQRVESLDDVVGPRPAT